ncbi:unnamed protein product [Gordionus sp. m RMFG-2023]
MLSGSVSILLDTVLALKGQIAQDPHSLGDSTLGPSPAKNPIGLFKCLSAFVKWCDKIQFHHVIGGLESCETFDNLLTQQTQFSMVEMNEGLRLLHCLETEFKDLIEGYFNEIEYTFKDSNRASTLSNSSGFADRLTSMESVSKINSLSSPVNRNSLSSYSSSNDDWSIVSPVNHVSTNRRNQPIDDMALPSPNPNIPIYAKQGEQLINNDFDTVNKNSLIYRNSFSNLKGYLNGFSSYQNGGYKPRTNFEGLNLDCRLIDNDATTTINRVTPTIDYDNWSPSQKDIRYIKRDSVNHEDPDLGKANSFKFTEKSCGQNDSPFNSPFNSPLRQNNTLGKADFSDNRVSNAGSTGTNNTGMIPETLPTWVRDLVEKGDTWGIFAKQPKILNHSHSFSIVSNARPGPPTLNDIKVVKTDSSSHTQNQYGQQSPDKFKRRMTSINKTPERQESCEGKNRKSATEISIANSVKAISVKNCQNIVNQNGDTTNTFSFNIPKPDYLVVSDSGSNPLPRNIPLNYQTPAKFNFRAHGDAQNISDLSLYNPSSSFSNTNINKKGTIQSLDQFISKTEVSSNISADTSLPKISPRHVIEKERFQRARADNNKNDFETNVFVKEEGSRGHLRAEAKLVRKTVLEITVPDNCDPEKILSDIRARLQQAPYDIGRVTGNRDCGITVDDVANTDGIGRSINANSDNSKPRINDRTLERDAVNKPGTSVDGKWDEKYLEQLLKEMKYKLKDENRQTLKSAARDKTPKPKNKFTADKEVIQKITLKSVSSPTARISAKQRNDINEVISSLPYPQHMVKSLGEDYDRLGDGGTILSSRGYTENREDDIYRAEKPVTGKDQIYRLPIAKNFGREDVKTNRERDFGREQDFTLKSRKDSNNHFQFLPKDVDYRQSNRGDLNGNRALISFENQSKIDDGSVYQRYFRQRSVVSNDGINLDDKFKNVATYLQTMAEYSVPDPSMLYRESTEYFISDIQNHWNKISPNKCPQHLFEDMIEDFGSGNDYLSHYGTNLRDPNSPPLSTHRLTMTATTPPKSKSFRLEGKERTIFTAKTPKTKLNIEPSNYPISSNDHRQDDHYDVSTIYHPAIKKIEEKEYNTSAQPSLASSSSPTFSVSPSLSSSDSITTNILDLQPKADLVFKKEDLKFIPVDREIVKSGTLPAFLVYATCPFKNDFLFQEAFLVIYRTFVTPHHLITLLLSRLDHFMSVQNVAPVNKRTFRCTFSFLYRILDDVSHSELVEAPTPYLYPQGPLLTARLNDKISELIDFGELKLAKILRDKLRERTSKLPPDSLNRSLSDNNLAKDNAVPPLSEPNLNHQTPPISVSQSLNNVFVNSSGTILDNLPGDILSFKCKDLAEQMTLLDSDLFNQLPIKECLVWALERNEALTPHLAAFTKHFNDVSYWYRTYILTRPTDLIRHKTFRKCLKIMKHLERDYGNFNSILALLSALDSSPVTRVLKPGNTSFSDKCDSQTTNHHGHNSHHTPHHGEDKGGGGAGSAGFSVSETEEIERFRSLIDSAGSFRNYRKALASTQPPCIPYIGLVLQDLTFIDVGNQNFTPDGHINFTKCWQFFTVLQSLKRYREKSYKILPNAKILEFFGGFTNHLSEEELWKMSESIKPRNR